MPTGRSGSRCGGRWADATTDLRFDPLELLELVAVLTPRPRVNLILCYGVLARPRSSPGPHKVSTMSRAFVETVCEFGGVPLPPDPAHELDDLLRPPEWFRHVS